MSTPDKMPEVGSPPEQRVFEEGEEPPPRGMRVMAVVRWLLLAVAVAVAIFSVARFAMSDDAAGQVATESKFYCPMHTQIRSPTPGSCPICGMTLVPIPPEQQEEHVGHDHAAPPPSARSISSASPSASPSASAPMLMAPSSVTTIDLPLDRIQTAGVRFAVAERKALGASVRAPASVVATDEGRAEVHSRASGFVEIIQARESGVEVKRGAPLLAFYSPEIFQAQQELLASEKWAQTGADTDESPLANQSARIRQRLELLGVSRFELDHVVKTKKALRATSIQAPIGGVITAKNVVLGSFVTPDMVLYEIVDLGKVYVVADLFQSDVASVPLGTKGTFTTPRAPDRTFEAEVDLVYPQVDLASRTTRMRLRVKNPDHVLLPGQFGSVAFAISASDGIVVPRDAIVDTGQATYVFVAEGEGRFVPQAVELGRDLGEQVEIRRGLEPGTRVVSGATFLIDAESRLSASLQTGGAAQGASGSAVAGPCDADFDRAKFPDKWAECKKCGVHRGMGNMEQDCKNAIAKPWK